MQTSSHSIEQVIKRNADINRRFYKVTVITVAIALTLGGIAAIAKTGATLPDSSPFIIEDSGPGEAVDERDKVFRRFYRLEQSRG